jgi:two-component system, NtrC family, nitrogen regulation sensor histidine kinase NtrY
LRRAEVFADNGATLRNQLFLLCLLGVAVACVATAVAAALVHVFEPGIAWPFVVLAASVVGLLVLAHPLLRALRLLGEIERGLARLAKGDFVAPIGPSRGRGLGRIASSVNALAAFLRQRQQSAEQSEALLHTLIDAAPMAILLLEDGGAIEYANDTARTLFFEGRSLAKANFLSMLGEAPAAFREAVLGDQDCLFSVTTDGAPETYHLAKRHFELHGSTHTLLMVKHLTRELRRQEIDIWKKLVRVVSHELNNSLAPIKSLVHSARIMTKSDASPKLDRVFSTIDERASHLQGFVESYARFARLPSPRRENVELGEFLAHVATLAPYARVVTSPSAVRAAFDRSQLEQLIINLLKNAKEAGGPADGISLDVKSDGAGGAIIVVEDRGPGMSPEVLESATLPFYSTKEGGSGLGLALCREIVEAHGGGIRLENREGGGLTVTCTIPGPAKPATAPKARLTLSHV